MASEHVYRLRLRAFADRLRGSLLFLPVVLLLAAVLSELGISALDRRYDLGRLPFALALSPDAAISLLGTIAGATVTTAGVVFSLLVVSLQLASGQFSPRVLRGFYRDRMGQAVTGLLLATFAYCVLALSRIDTAADRAPTLTVEVGVVLALASITGIIAYLDRISRRQYVGSITQRIADETLDLVRALPWISEPAGRPCPPPDLGALGQAFLVPAPADGWIQQFSARVVLEVVPPGTVVRMETRVGAYVVRGVPMASVWPVPPHPDEVAAALDDAVIIGDARSMQEDIDFGLRQLNDIALRALSPAVNDPTTAIEVVARLASVLRPLLLADLPPQSVVDDQGRHLLTPWDLDHGEYVRHAFDQLRQVAAPHPAVAVAVLRTLRMLTEACQLAGRGAPVPALERQIQLTLAGCERAGLLAEDMAAVRTATAPQFAWVTDPDRTAPASPDGRVAPVTE